MLQVCTFSYLISSQIPKTVHYSSNSKILIGKQVMQIMQWAINVITILNRSMVPDRIPLEASMSFP